MQRFFYGLLFVLTLISKTSFAYGAPKGLYVLEYPVNMPNITLLSENSQKTSILDSSADLTIFIFWAQSCAPCLREMKSLEKFYPKAEKDNIKVMLVSPTASWNNTEEERAFLVKYGAPTLPFYNDTDNKLSLSLGIGSTPYTVIMDKNGKKVATIQGEADWSSSKLYKKIKQLIK
jgi:thiol-disulfide isomerase/thioredoxin